MTKICQGCLGKEESPRPARIVVVEHLYYQQTGENPVAIDIGYSVNLQSTEQIYIRKFQVLPEWKMLDKGWIEKASLLAIKTMGEKHVEVAIMMNGDIIPFATVSPGASLRMEPIILDLFLKSAEPTLCTLYLFPE